MINSQWNSKSFVPFHPNPFQRRLIWFAILFALTTARVINCTNWHHLNESKRQNSFQVHRRHVLSTSEADLLASSSLGQHHNQQQQPKQSDHFAPGQHHEQSPPPEPTPPLEQNHIGRTWNQIDKSPRDQLQEESIKSRPLLRPNRAFVVGGRENGNELNEYNVSPRQLEPLKTRSIDSNLNDGQFELPPDGESDHQERFMQQDSSVGGSYSPPDGPNLLDLIEPGSGIGYENVPFDRPDEQSNSLQSAGAFSEHSPTLTNLGPLMTPIFDQMPPIGLVPSQLYDQAPVLTRRLPRLVGTAGSAWRYKVPSGTFQDEDGDLRYLRSALVEKQFVGMIDFDNVTISDANGQQSTSSTAARRHLEWLQYDQSTQTLYGFPTETDIGLNEFLLLVSDRWGFSSNETIRIAIRPHQSSRAVTHLIKFQALDINSAHSRRVPVSDLLTNLVKSVSEGVFAERSGKNMIVQSYTLTDPTSSNSTTTSDDTTSLQWAPPSSESRPVLSVTWFNSSLPIHPCDPTGVESIFRALIDERQLPSDWSMLSHVEANFNYQPSQVLIKSLQPDWRPASVEIQLIGACENKRFSADTSNGSSSSQLAAAAAAPRVRSRLGKLQWKLGQPISYKIPEEIFAADDGHRTTRNLSLTLHTIDGKLLDQELAYNFLEFDQETQTIFGLPHDLSRHVGQRELLLTARHPATGQRVRETFIIDIEAQDLTTINNRAFRVSLYFMTRVNVFGPREQVLLSHRIVSALESGGGGGGDQNSNLRSNFLADQQVINSNGGGAQDADNADQYLDFTVIQIQKFTAGSYIDNSATLSDPSNTWKFQDKIFPIFEDSLAPTGADQGNRQQVAASSDSAAGELGGNTIFYKLTWTNETIGHRGDCPVEVIKENILHALSMVQYIAPPSGRQEDITKNESVRFYERLRAYFEPSIDLIHLRFEPTSACVEALELHDVGNSDIADIVDRAEDLDSAATETPLANILAKSLETSRGNAMPKSKTMSPINSDEYWAIVVLIILVVAIFFVVMMLIMGLNTYRINQEKRLELQMKLAQARQNSMYLSSMVLADHLQPSDLIQTNQQNRHNVIVDELNSRKPTILDNEKQLVPANGIGAPVAPFLKATSVQQTGQTFKTSPLEPNVTFTMDQMNGFQARTMLANMGQNVFADQHHHQQQQQQRSIMTLNRRTNGRQAIPRQASMASQLSHSQSIITVASVAPSQGAAFVQSNQANVPFVYAPMPMFYESNAETPYEL